MPESASNARWCSLVEAIRTHAELRGPSVAFRFQSELGSEQRLSTFEDIDRGARAIAASLQAVGARGERVLLLYPPGPDYPLAYLACLYAGAIAVPAYPPRPGSLARSARRLQQVARDCGAAIVLTQRAVAERAPEFAMQAPELAEARWIATDELPVGLHQLWKPVEPAPSDLAFLQYTSGSTGTPKGVAVSHANLVHQLCALREQVQGAAGDRLVSWLPPYHDMGLIGGILYPLFAGIEAVLLTPLGFLKRPYRWLEAISRHRATISVAPNFAYELCVERITAHERAQLELGCWELAMCGAEPVRHATLQRFRAAFAPCGLRLESLYPCYGLAEGTLMVSGHRRAVAPRSLCLERDAYQRGQIRLCAEPEPEHCVRAVGCGTPIAGTELAVVDPDTRELCGEGEIGEIWVRGPSVAQGYWGRPEESVQVFGARLAGAEQRGAFLRSGDLGFLHGGELYVTGRSKDAMVIRGRNLHPEDVEAALLQGAEPAFSASFEVESERGAQLVVVLEASDAAAAERALASAAAQILAEHELRADWLVCVRSHSIPRTSSGKVQRGLCRELWLGGALEERVLLCRAGQAASGSPVRALRPVRPAAEPQQDEVALGALWGRSRVALAAPGADLEAAR